MFEVLLVSAALALCQSPVTMDGGVVRFQDADQWVLGDGTYCWRSTKLSPDERGLVDAAMAGPLPGRSGGPLPGRIPEQATIPPRPETGPIAGGCPPTYSARSVDLQFRKDQEVLLPSSVAALTALLAESPKGITVVGFVPDGAQQKEVLPLVRRRMQTVMGMTEKLAVRRPSITQEERAVEATGSSQRPLPSIEVIGSLVKPCRAQIAERRLAPSGSVPTTTAGTPERQGGAAMAR